MLPALLLPSDVRWAPTPARPASVAKFQQLAVISANIGVNEETTPTTDTFNSASDLKESCWERETRFWMTGARELRPARMASNYAGPLLFVLGLLSISALKPLAAVVATFGIYETLRAWQMQSKPYAQIHDVVNTQQCTVSCFVSLTMLGSIVAHAAVYVPYLWLQAEPLAVLWSTLTLLSFLAIYRLFDAWPYSVPPLHAVVLCVCIQIVNQW